MLITSIDPAPTGASDIACRTWDHRDDPAWQDSVWPQLQRTPSVVPVPDAAADGCLCPPCLAPAIEATQRSA